MPSFKKKPPGEGRGEWSEEGMKQAVKNVLESRMTERAAAEHFKIPRTTLQRRIKSVMEGKQTNMKPAMGFYKTTFEEEYEQILVGHMKDLDLRLLPLAKTEFLKLAFSLAESLKLPHRFNKATKMAGKDFYYSFMKRHPELTYRKPQATSLMRCVGFNKPQVDRFFTQLRLLMDKHSFRPSRMFNGDETGVSCVHENEKVITMKGKRQVGKMTSAERGRNVTLMFCMSATGQFIPPLFIFPRKRMNDRLMIGAPAESCAFPTSSGWMTTEAFLKWMQHFVSFSKPTKDDPVLLLVDGHGTHKELEVILFARNNHVHMLSFPPHTTHKLQPLDRSFMKPFKGQYNHACSLWMRANAGTRINDYDIAKLVDESYKRVCRLDIAVNGFSCTGIFPFNPEIFTDLDYMGSSLTEMDPPRPAMEPAEAAETSIAVSSPERPGTIAPQPSTATSGENDPVAVESALTAGGGPLNDSGTMDQLFFASVLKNISPLPSCAEKRATTRKRKAEKSEILTSTPNKDRLVEKKKLEAEKEDAKEAKRKIKFEKAQQKTKKPKTSRTVKCKPIDYTNPTPGTSKQDPIQVNCIICGENFEENWIQCRQCEGWAHELCADLDDKLYYDCDRCKMIN